jgi:phytoene dehydrogenase-like protein
MDSKNVDAVVVGSGFGGLGAALTLAERGARVVVCEALRYPGGCAGRFTHEGVSFDAGATMGTGLEPDGLFGRLLARHAPELVPTPLDPVLEVRTPTLRVPIPATRAQLVAQLSQEPGAPSGLAAFFDEQRRVADVGWAVIAGEAPPGALGAALPFARGLFRSALDRMVAHGVDGFAPLRAVVEALCRITVQVPAAEAESSFALSALDYPFRGVRHVPGGLGAVADVLVTAIRAAGGEVLFTNRVRGLTREGGRWIADTRQGRFTSPRVFANVAPHALPGLAGVDTPRVRRMMRRVETGAGAAASFLQLSRPLGDFHLDLTADPTRPTVAGNHVLCSVSGDTAVVTTHVPQPATPEEVGRIQAELRRTLERLAPEVASVITKEWTASPRTWARFTFRPGGWVGGVPRRVGPGAYAELLPRAVAPGLWLVGDAVGFGQSTLATFITGRNTARWSLAGTRPGHSSG